MEKESAREEEHNGEPSAENESKAVTAGDDSLDAMELAPDEVPGIDIIDDEPPPESKEQGSGSALERSIGIGLPSDRYRVILPKGSFPPLNGRQQFIARLRDRDKVSFRIFQGDEELASENEFLAEVGMVGIALNNEEKAFLEVDFHLNIDRILRIRLQDKFGEKESYIILDMTGKRKASIREDSIGDLMRKLESIEQKVGELSHGTRGGAGGAMK